MDKIKNVLVVGVFDLFHRGHLELLRSASKHGKLYVIVNGDDFTESYKRRPIINEADRLEIVSSLKFVAHAQISNGPDVKGFVEKYGIGKIIHGDDWDHLSYMRQICVDEEYLERNGVQIVYTEYYRGTSTSQLIELIRGRHET